jgi:hypothetical protein
MWMVNPKLLCNNHLLGEHGEIHKHRHNFEKKHKMDGRLSPVVQIEPMSMQSRHDELAKEMLHRNINHKSPFLQPDISYLQQKGEMKVDMMLSLVDLSERCNECKKRIENETYRINKVA